MPSTSTSEVDHVFSCRPRTLTRRETFDPEKRFVVPLESVPPRVPPIRRQAPPSTTGGAPPQGRRWTVTGVTPVVV